MGLNDIVIASLSQAQESIGFTSKSAEYLRREYSANVPDVSNTIHPNKFSGDEFSPEVNCDLEGKHVYLFAVPTNPANYIHYVKPDAMIGRVILATRTAKEHGAGYVTVVAPDLFFSRADKGMSDIPADAPQDKKNLFMGKGKSAEAQAIVWKAIGVDRVLTLHCHSQRVIASYESVYGRKDALIDLSPSPLLVYYLANYSMIDWRNRGQEVVIIRPDLGAEPFVNEVHHYLIGLGFVNVSRVDFEKVRKRQNDPNRVEVENPTFSDNYSGLEGKIALLCDDVDDTWGTKAATANTMLNEGIWLNSKGNHKPENFISYATHPVMSGIQFESAMRKAAAVEPLEIIFTNTHPFIEDNMIYELRKRTSIIRTAWFFGEAIRHLEEGIDVKEAYLTNGNIDTKKISKFMPPPFRRTEHPKYQYNHS